MADIKLSLVNQALTNTGEDPVTSLTGENAFTRAAIENYDEIVNEELEKNEPKFAQKVGTPTLLTAQSDPPLLYRWQLPADFLASRSVLFEGWDLLGDKFEIEGRVIRTAYNESVTVKYIYRPDEALWTYKFRRIIIMRLESVFLRVSERHNEAEEHDKSTERRSVIARHADARQRSNRPINDGSIIEARMGQRRRR